MQESHQSEAEATASSRRWALGLTLLVLALQVALALLLQKLLKGQEVSSDVQEYRNYVEYPLILLNPPPDANLVGGWVAAPLLPLLLAPIYQPLRFFGASEFLAFRGTMIFWFTLGFGITVYEVFRRWGPPRTKREILIALAFVISPLTWLPSAVLAQDETVAGMWCGLCFVCWSRGGVWACWVAAALGVLAAKPFLLVYFAALWMAYPPQRKMLVLASSALLFLLLGFMYLRDGQLRLLHHSVQSYMSGSLYSVAWLWDQTPTFDASRAHRQWAKEISTIPTLLAMASYILLALRVRFTLPSAIVGIYGVMFTFLVGMMPEYELWYWSWSMLLIWIACSRGEWLLACLLYGHSILGYAYKILYSCDSKNYYTEQLKPTAKWYDQHIAVDLWWVMLLLSIALVLNTLCLSLLIWRKYPRLIEDPVLAAS